MALSVFLTSDLHLGMRFVDIPDEPRSALIEARFACFQTMVEEAGRRGCDLFVVAGDLFDRVSVPARDVHRAAEILRAFSGKLAVVMPGNHDYIGPGDSLWPGFRSACGDAVLLLEEPRPYALGRYDVDACLYPGPCLSRHSKTNAVQWVKEAAREPGISHHIGIAHGSLEGFSPDFKENYYPMRTAELLQAGMEAWLIGHTHVPYPKKPTRADRIFYPGTPEPDGFDCGHEGSAWVLRLDREAGIQTEQVHTGTFRFVDETVTVRGPQDIEAFESRHAGEDARKVLLRARLSGRLPREKLAEIGSVRQRMAGALFFADIRADGLAEEIMARTIDEQYPQGSFPHSLLHRLAGSEDAEALALAHELLEESRR